MAFTRTVEVQTVYRESEVQTDPYSPDYVVAPGANPEVLTIAHFCANKGLPITDAEIQIIERMRQKRLLESKLPPATDEFSMRLREKLVDAFEFEEWRAREENIKKLHARRLELVKAALDARENKKEALNAEKIERIKALCIEQRDRALDANQAHCMRVVASNHRVLNRVKSKLYPEDKSCVHMLYDKESRYYKPLVRDGRIPMTRTAKIEVDPIDLKGYVNLVGLERSLPDSMLSIKWPDRDPNILKATQAKQRLYNKLDKALERTLLSLRSETPSKSFSKLGDEEDTPTTGVFTPRQDKNKEDVGLVTQSTMAGTGTVPGTLIATETMATGTITNGTVLVEDSAEDNAILFLQRVIRGRALQNQMFAGKDKRLDLIAELRARDALLESHKWAQEREREQEKTDADGVEDTLASTDLSKAFVEGEALSAVIGAVGGSVIASALEALSDELHKLEEQRRVDAMAKLAERDRRRREAEDAGHRQAETILREREERLFLQVMGTNQQTVDSWLENVLVGSVKGHARAAAMAEAQLRAKLMSDVVDELEEAVDSRAVVRDLVSSFLIPHVHRNEVKRQVQAQQNKFVEAADAAVGAVLVRKKQEEQQ